MNLACLALLRNDLFGYLSALRRVIQRTEYRQDFIGAVCGSEFEFSVSELFVPAFEELLRNCPFDAVQEAVEELGSRPLSKKFAEVALGLLLRNIEKEIQQGSEADTKAWDELFAEGSRLLAATDAWVSGIAALSESNSITVQITLDKLAARILVCATQFYDEDESDERYDQAESMMKRALEIAVGEEQLHDCEVELERLRFSRILAL
jgi:hypothetical protein